jgi:4-oxalocrotonate tautomerase
MPIVRIDHPNGKPASYKTALSNGVHAALREIFAVPEHDRFHVLAEHSAATLIHPAAYLGVEYSSDFVMIQITCNDTRTVEQKKLLYCAIADRLSAAPGLRREDILINIVEVKKENWSFGNGLAQYAT